MNSEKEAKEKKKEKKKRSQGECLPHPLHFLFECCENIVAFRECVLKLLKFLCIQG